METRTMKDLEYCRGILAKPVIGKLNNVRFDFTANADVDTKRYDKEEDKNSGRFKLTNLANGDSYGGSYSIGSWIEGECKMTMTFTDFAISGIDGLGEYRQGMLMKDFDEMIEYLVNKFPTFAEEN